MYRDLAKSDSALVWCNPVWKWWMLTVMIFPMRKAYRSRNAFYRNSFDEKFHFWKKKGGKFLMFRLIQIEFYSLSQYVTSPTGYFATSHSWWHWTIRKPRLAENRLNIQSIYRAPDQWNANRWIYQTLKKRIQLTTRSSKKVSTSHVNYVARVYKCRWILWRI